LTMGIRNFNLRKGHVRKKGKIGLNQSLIHIHPFLNNEQDSLIIQIYSVIKLYMFRASSLPIIRSFLLYIRHW